MSCVWYQEMNLLDNILIVITRMVEITQSMKRSSPPKPLLILPNLLSTLCSTKLLFSLRFCHFRSFITITLKLKTRGLNSTVDIYERTNVIQLGSMFVCNCNIALHVSDAFCVYLQKHLKTVETASGEWHETVWGIQQGVQGRWHPH